MSGEKAAKFEVPGALRSVPGRTHSPTLGYHPAAFDRRVAVVREMEAGAFDFLRHVSGMPKGADGADDAPKYPETPRSSRRSRSGGRSR